MQTNAFPLKLDMEYRGASLLGLHVLNGKIVYLHTVLEGMPREQVTKDTIFPQHIIADFFSPMFKEHTQAKITYAEKKTFYTTCSKCYGDKNRLLLNTLYYVPSGYYHGDGQWGELQSHEANALAKILEVKENSIRESGESPKPIQQTYSDSKTYLFGNYILRMATKWKLECRSADTGTLIWDMRLTAWLYSELEERNGVLYFGTAGQGGHFYGVSLADGHIIFDWNTGGTTAVVWINDDLAITDRNGDLVLLNPENGSEVKRFHFKRMVISAGGLVHEGKLYTVMHDKKEYYSFYAVCLELHDPAQNRKGAAEAPEGGMQQ